LLSFPQELIVDLHAHALARLRVVNNSFLTAVARFAQNQALDGQLSAIGGPNLQSGFRLHRPAVLVVHRGHGALCALDQVELGDNPEPLAGKGYRAGMNRLFALFAGSRQRIGLLIDPPMLNFAFDGVGAVLEDSLDPFIKEQPRQ